MESHKTRSLILAILVVGVLGADVSAAQIKDRESATHGDSASRYEITETYDYPGFQLIQINLAVLSHYSYVIASDGMALVVDSATYPKTTPD